MEKEAEKGLGSLVGVLARFPLMMMILISCTVWLSRKLKEGEKIRGGGGGGKGRGEEEERLRCLEMRICCFSFGLVRNVLVGTWGSTGV